MNISVVIPVFNDTTALPLMLQRLYQVAQANSYELEVVVVDDASSASDTWKNMIALKENNPERNIVLVRLNRNVGQHLATLIGLRCSHARWAVTMDADLQHPPEEIPKLIQAITDQRADLVYGTTGEGHAAHYRLLSRVFKFLTNRHGNPAGRHASSFRALNMELLKHLDGSRPFVAIDTPLLDRAQEVRLVNTAHHKSQARQSSYSGGKRIRLALNVLCSGKSFYRSACVIAAAFFGMGIVYLSPLLHDAAARVGAAALCIISGFLLLLCTFVTFKRQKGRIILANENISEILQ